MLHHQSCRKRAPFVSGKWISSSGHAPKHTSPKTARSTLDLVRDGVRRFMLHDASLGDFRKAIRAAARKGEGSPPSMTGAAFRKIVRQVIAEKKRKSAPRPQGGASKMTERKPSG
jgi:hypothetical protein